MIFIKKLYNKICTLKKYKILRVLFIYEYNLMRKN